MCARRPGRVPARPRPGRFNVAAVNAPWAGRHGRDEEGRRSGGKRAAAQPAQGRPAWSTRRRRTRAAGPYGGPGGILPWRECGEGRARRRGEAELYTRWRRSAHVDRRLGRNAMLTASRFLSLERSRFQPFKTEESRSRFQRMERSRSPSSSGRMQRQVLRVSLATRHASRRHARDELCGAARAVGAGPRAALGAAAAARARLARCGSLLLVARRGRGRQQLRAGLAEDRGARRSDRGPEPARGGRADGGAQGAARAPAPAPSPRRAPPAPRTLVARPLPRPCCASLARAPRAHPGRPRRARRRASASPPR